MLANNKSHPSMTDSEVTEYLNEMRGHANPDVREFFADKISEQEACLILKCALGTLRTNRSRGVWNLTVTHVNRKPVLYSTEVVAVLQRAAKVRKKRIPRSEI